MIILIYNIFIIDPAKQIKLKLYKIVILQIINLTKNLAMTIDQLKIIFTEMNKQEQAGVVSMKI
jgi:hypothetical protein